MVIILISRICEFSSSFLTSLNVYNPLINISLIYHVLTLVQLYFCEILLVFSEYHSLCVCACACPHAYRVLCEHACFCVAYISMLWNMVVMIYIYCSPFKFLTDACKGKTMIQEKKLYNDFLYLPRIKLPLNQLNGQLAHIKEHWYAYSCSHAKCLIFAFLDVHRTQNSAVTYQPWSLEVSLSNCRRLSMGKIDICYLGFNLKKVIFWTSTWSPECSNAH